MSSTERTPLRSSDQGMNYVFNTIPLRTYRSRIRKFQCCVCAAVFAVFVLALVITVSWTVNHNSNDSPSTPSPTGNLTAIPMQRLLQMSWPLPAVDNATHWPEELSSMEVEAAIEVGINGLIARDVLEENSTPLAVNTPSYRHQKAIGTGELATQLARIGYIMDLATRDVVKRMKERNETWSLAGRGPRLYAMWLPEEVCGDGPKFVDMCLKTPYRSADGVCNNPNHPRKWGVAMRPFRRILPPDYADGVSAPRMAADGASLPSARKVSQLIHRPMYRDDPDFTVMLAVWGQFMDHDITATALSQGFNMSAISCCDAVDTPERLHPECYTVRLSDGDPYYNQYNVSCMEFVRSAPAPMCSLGPREQLNQASSYLDGSVVYGSSSLLTRELRSLEGGKLKMTLTPDGRSLLPFNQDPTDGCNQEEEAKRGRYCFASGDSRANENIHLTTMHLLLARQHNQAAQQLSVLNPTWDDERLFQEARRIVAAQMQHITYNEFVPVLLGRNLMEKMDIFPMTSGYHSGYNASVDPTIANEFAAAAFRFAHTLLPGLIRMIGNDNSSDDYVELHKMLFNPFELYNPGQLDSTIRGAIATNTQRVDPYFTKEVTEKLFQAPRPVNGGKPPCGLDLVSLNIQRGRDHGLPGYPAWRRRCGLTVPQNFEDLKGMIDDDTVQRITTMYRSVEDIDMYTGALSEFPVEGGVLGPTVVCLLADQFYRLKKGDRFWYETDQEPQAFTPEQLHEIRKTTLAGIICANSDHIVSAQPWVMRTKKPGNVPVPCYGSTIEHPDLSLWEEKNGVFVRPGIGRVRLGPHDSIISIRKKQFSPAEEDSKWKTETAKWKAEISKWRDQIQKWKNDNGYGNNSTSNLNDGSSEGQAEDAEDIAEADEEMGLWSDDNGTIPVHSTTSIKRLLKRISTNQSHINTHKVVIGRVLSGSVTAMADGIFPVVWWSGDLPMVIARKPFDSIGNNTVIRDIMGDMPVFNQGIHWNATMQNISEVTQLKGSFALQKYIHEPVFSVQWWTGVFTLDVVLDNTNDSTLLSYNLFSSPLYLHNKEGQSLPLLDYRREIQPNVDIKFETLSQISINSSKKAPLILLGSFLGKSQFLWSGEFILLLSNSTPNISENVDSTSDILVNDQPTNPDDPNNIAKNKTLGVVELQDEISKWKDQILKWKDEDAEWKKIDSQWKDIFSDKIDSTTIASPVDAIDTADADEEIGLWTNDKTYVPVHNTSSLPQFLKDSYNNQSQAYSPKAVFGRVLSGSVTGQTEGIFPVVWWSGQLPLVITKKPFDSQVNNEIPKDVLGDVPIFGQGIHWNATMKNNSGIMQVKGTFSVQRYMHDPIFSMQWWTGEFSFDVIVDDEFNYTPLPSDVSFSSPLYFHKKNDQSPALLNYQGANIQPSFGIKFQTPSQGDVNSDGKAPLIFLGSFLGQSSFMWSGEFILVLPTATMKNSIESSLNSKTT